MSNNANINAFFYALFNINRWLNDAMNTLKRAISSYVRFCDLKIVVDWIRGEAGRYVLVLMVKHSYVKATINILIVLSKIDQDYHDEMTRLNTTCWTLIWCNLKRESHILGLTINRFDCRTCLPFRKVIRSTRFHNIPLVLVIFDTI